MAKPIESHTERRIRIMKEALDNRDREILMWRTYGGDLEAKLRDQAAEIERLKSLVEPGN